MNLIRLGDRIESRRVSERTKTHSLNQHLAQGTFNTLLTPQQVLDYYIPSRPIEPRPALSDILKPEGLALGDFEALIIEKLVRPKRPVLCIIGQMGCGKTTTKDYILQTLRDCVHCSDCADPHERTICNINFNERVYLNNYVEDENKLTSELLAVLCEQLRGRLVLHRKWTYAEEFTDFWKQEIDALRNHESTSQAFIRLSSLMGTESLSDIAGSSERYFPKCTETLGKIEQDKELYFDYLIRLWRYVIRAHYQGKNGCAFVIFDNLDWVAPVVQRKLVDIVRQNAKVGGPTFLFLLRPETFEIAGLSTGIIDAEDYRGPTPTDVVLDRLQRFCDNPQKFLEPHTVQSSPQFDPIKAFISRVNNMIRADPHQTFQRFLEYTCGSSKRTALVMAQGLFYVGVTGMEDPNIAVHDLVRTCITGGERQLKWKPNSPTEHLFRVYHSENNSMLVKPRILRYLGRSAGGRRRFFEIHHAMSDFGYADDLIREAVNDLLRMPSQLIRSNNFDVFDSQNALSKYGGHTFKLTETGRGYSDYLISNVHYLQEVMLDTYVDGDNFPARISFDYLNEKFRLLYLFLEELRKVDYEETAQFINKWHIEAYFATFGKHLIALDIIQGAYPAAVRIITSQIPRVPQHAHDYEELNEYFKSLALRVEADNDNLLGITEDSVVNRLQGSSA